MKRRWRDKSVLFPLGLCFWLELRMLEGSRRGLLREQLLSVGGAYALSQVLYRRTRPKRHKPYLRGYEVLLPP